MPVPDPNSTGNNPPQPASLAQERKNALLNGVIAVVVIALLAVKFPYMVKGALIFIVTLSILVFVHEWGHYQFARWGGMKVNRFGIGFPPWIFTKRRNGIDYSIGALPIGGMVDIAGLGSEEEMVATAKGEAGENMASQRPANPSAPHGQKMFQDAKLGWRFMTLFAGPMMNFIFATLLFITLFSVIGKTVDSEATTVIGFVRPNMPAYAGGLQIGDKVVAVNNAPIQDAAQLSRIIQDSNRTAWYAALPVSTPQAEASGNFRVELGSKPIKPIVFTVLRHDNEIDKTITPQLSDIPYFTAQGRMDSFKAPAVGIEFDEKVTTEKVGIAVAVKEGWRISAGLTTRILEFIGRALTFNLTREETRSIGGPVKIAQEVTKSARGGFYQACMMAAAISVNLGLMNLLPFPALDGGRILFLGYELIFRRPIDAKKEGFVHMMGMAMLLMFILAITVKDVWPWVMQGIRGILS